MNQTLEAPPRRGLSPADPPLAGRRRRKTPDLPPPLRWRIAIVHAAWHTNIVQRARDAARDALVEGGIAATHIALHEVPGAFEIPLHAKRLIESGCCDAVIACALVVNGGIYRHEFVAQAVIDGLMRVQLDTNVPVFSAVLTPRDFHEHEEHRRFFEGHFVKKGQEVAHAALRTLHSLATIAA